MMCVSRGWYLYCDVWVVWVGVCRQDQPVDWRLIFVMGTSNELWQVRASEGSGIWFTKPIQVVCGNSGPCNPSVAHSHSAVSHRRPGSPVKGDLGSQSFFWLRCGQILRIFSAFLLSPRHTKSIQRGEKLLCPKALQAKSGGQKREKLA